MLVLKVGCLRRRLVYGCKKRVGIKILVSEWEEKSSSLFLSSEDQSIGIAMVERERCGGGDAKSKVEQAELPFRAGRDPSVAGITHPFLQRHHRIALAALGAKSDPGAATTSVPCHVHIHNDGET